MAFTGFNKTFFTFFEELAANNNRAWFEENKARYEGEVAEVCLDFIQAVGAPLSEISPYMTAIPKKQGGSMFRIYRDTRFSKDKTPYKTHAGLQFRHSLSKDAHAPGYYVHLAPDEIFFGGGMWKPDSEAVKKIRQAIDEKPNLWQHVLDDDALRKTYGGLDEGDPLKRAPKGFDPDHPYIKDLNKRSFFCIRKSTKTAAGKASFVHDVADGFDAMAPLMEFLCKSQNVGF